MKSTKKNTVVLIISILLSAGCNDRNSSGTLSEEQKKNDTTQTENVSEFHVDSVKDSISCLNISFIENLETGGLSGYKDPRLVIKGYSYKTIRTIENGKERLFENSTLKNQLKISKIEYPDGETSFIVKYQVTSEQLKCFEESLVNSLYVKTDKEQYSKKGLGSYEAKLIVCNSKSLSITYTHQIRKELSLPLPNHTDTIKLLDATNRY